MTEEKQQAIGQNLLLNALAGDQVEALMPALELLSLKVRHSLYESDVPIDYVYFPIDGIHSMLALVEDDREIEVGTVGKEGMTGLPLFLGSDRTPGRAFVQVAGQAYRLPAADFKKLIQGPSRITSILHRYTQALMVQIYQGTACNRAHPDDQRCARWLLISHDRVGRDEISLRQEFLAQMLGMPYEAVHEIAARFQADGLIDYSGKSVTRIANRAGLEAVSCGCYQVVRKEYDRMYRDLER